jgi:hypothetical protein
MTFYSGKAEDTALQTSNTDAIVAFDDPHEELTEFPTDMTVGDVILD